MSSSIIPSSSLQDMRTFQQTIQKLLDVTTEKCLSARSDQGNSSETETKAILDPALTIINKARIILAEIKLNVTKKQLAVSKKKYLKCLQRYKAEELELRKLKQTVEDLDATQLLETSTELSLSNLNTSVNIEESPELYDVSSPPAQKKIRISPDSTLIIQEAHLNEHMSKSSTEQRQSPTRPRKTKLSSVLTQTRQPEAGSSSTATRCLSNPRRKSKEHTSRAQSASKQPRNASTVSTKGVIPLATTSKSHKAQSDVQSSKIEPLYSSKCQKKGKELLTAVPAAEKAHADDRTKPTQLDSGSMLGIHLKGVSAATVKNKIILPSMHKQTAKKAHPGIQQTSAKAREKTILPSKHKEITKEAQINAKSNPTEPFSSTARKEMKQEPILEDTVEEAQSEVECNLPEPMSPRVGINLESMQTETTKIAQNDNTTSATGRKNIKNEPILEVTVQETQSESECCLPEPISARAGINLESMQEETTQIAQSDDPTSATAGKNIKWEPMLKGTVEEAQYEIECNLPEPISATPGKNIESIHKETSQIAKNGKTTSASAAGKKLDSMHKQTTSIAKNDGSISATAGKKLDSMHKQTTSIAKNDGSISATAGKKLDSMHKQTTSIAKNCRPTSAISVKNLESMRKQMTKPSQNNEPTLPTPAKNFILPSTHEHRIEKTSAAENNQTEISSTIVRRHSVPSIKSFPGKIPTKSKKTNENTKADSSNNATEMVYFPTAVKDNAAPSTSQHSSTRSITTKNIRKEQIEPANETVFKIPKINTTAVNTKTQNCGRPKERSQQKKLQSLIKKPKDLIAEKKQKDWEMFRNRAMAQQMLNPTNVSGRHLKRQRDWERFRDREMFRWKQQIEERKADVNNADESKQKKPIGNLSKNLPTEEPPKKAQSCTTDHGENIQPATSQNTQTRADMKKIAEEIIALITSAEDTTKNSFNYANKPRSSKKVTIIPFHPRRCSTPLPEIAKGTFNINDTNKLSEKGHVPKKILINFSDDDTNNRAPINDKAHQSQSGINFKKPAESSTGKFYSIPGIESTPSLQASGTGVPFIQPRIEAAVSMLTQSASSPFVIKPLPVSPKLSENIKKIRSPTTKEPAISFTQTLKDIEASSKQRIGSGQKFRSKPTTPNKKITPPLSKCSSRRKSYYMTDSQLSSILNRPDDDSTNVMLNNDFNENIPEPSGRYKSPEKINVRKIRKELPRKLSLSECLGNVEKSKKTAPQLHRDVIINRHRNIFKKPDPLHVQDSAKETPKGSSIDNQTQQWFNIDKVSEMLLYPDGSSKEITPEVIDLVLKNTLKGYVPRCASNMEN